MTIETDGVVDVSLDVFWRECLMRGTMSSWGREREIKEGERRGKTRQEERSRVK